MASGSVKLDKPISINEAMAGEGFTFQTNFEDENSSEEDFDTPEISNQLDNVKLEDEDLYEYNTAPFEEIEPLMTNVDEGGFVKKRIFREGKGDVIPRVCKATYHYKAYEELNPVPFDNSYRRRKPDISNLDYILYGLAEAIASMRLNEKAQFIIQPEWAYGVSGIISKLPPNATVLFEVELLSYVIVNENDDKDDYEQLKKNRDFKTNYDKALKLCEEASHLIKVEKKEKPAIRNYNYAISLLTNTVLENEDQEEKYVSLLIRLNKNLAITHNRLKQWKKCCIKCQEVYKLCNSFYRTVDEKVYYNHAKALFGLDEYERAEEKLRKAAKLVSYDRPNPDVMNLYKQIREAKENAAKSEKKMVEAMFGNSTHKEK